MATVPVSALVAEGALASEVWDACLAGATGAGKSRLRMGRYLDGIEDKKRVMIFPHQRVGGSVPVTVQPYHTGHDNLPVRCRRVPSGEGAVGRGRRS